MKPRALPVSQHEAAAFHDGRQTMFRRVMDPQPIMASFMGDKPVPAFHPEMLTDGVLGMAVDIFNLGGQSMVKCPYPVGRKLWVQETFTVFQSVDRVRKHSSGAAFSEVSDGQALYRADGHLSP